MTGSVRLILGKNGSGKSRWLREQSKGAGTPNRYVSPERGGTLKTQANVIQQMEDSRENSLLYSRMKNQFNQLKFQSAILFQDTILRLLDKFEQDMKLRRKENYTIDSDITDKINQLLPNIYIKRDKGKFTCRSRQNNAEIPPDAISSGESEIICVAIEILSFFYELETEQKGQLFLDEPDVHIHPDMQVGLINLLLWIIDKKDIDIYIATHSPTFVGALSSCKYAYIAYMHAGEITEFSPITEPLTEIVPAFGAHPISVIFNEKPLIIVEGEDDLQFIDHACRSSNGAIKLYPVIAGNKDKISEYENLAENVGRALLNNPRALSLRDRDDGTLPPEHLNVVCPIVLNCYAAENLLLTDTVLGEAGVNWDELIARVTAWLGSNPKHAHAPAMKKFLEEPDKNRQFSKVKEITNDFLHIIESNCAWPILVGKAIAKTKLGELDGAGEHGLLAYLGPTFCEQILGIPPAQNPAETAAVE